MQIDSIKIQVYNGKPSRVAVYVLSRGSNLGKVLNQPCPNCYTIQATPEILSEVRTVTQILFISEKLKPFLRGSVIEFVTVAAYRKAFLKFWRSLSVETISKTAAQLAALEAYAATVQKQLSEIHSLRKSIAFAALK